ncbi:MAG: glutaminyl-peptide cyclotransferase [candidate division Zixibacteria bacterium]|nr:glutaminyl-peptide cyclotransferase [candidate division Zixibacteria bacterium]
MSSCSESTGPKENEPEITRYYTYRVVTEYPHDAAAFTQGLAYVDSTLYEGTGKFGHSSLRRVELETGAVEVMINLSAQYFGEGITVLGDRIFQLTWQSNVGFIYDRTTLDSLGQFEYSTSGWGLTHDGSRFIMSDGSATLYFRDTTTFDVIKTISVHDSSGAVSLLNELEFINGQIYANIWMANRIVRISPSTGFVTGSIDLTGIIEWTSGMDVLNGIAYDSKNDRLFITGKNWPKLFEIELVEVESDE